MNSGDKQARLDMINYCWKGDFADSSMEMLKADPNKAELLRAHTGNSYYPDDQAKYIYKKDKRLNSLAGLMARNQNVHYMPKDQLTMATTSRHKRLKEDLWEMQTARRLLPSMFIA
jgi:hypothetical protein